jgi:hypothetical protein
MTKRVLKGIGLVLLVLIVIGVLRTMRAHADHATAVCAAEGKIAVMDSAGEFWCADRRVGWPR